jgi:DNA-binding MarR family transcriptional regulator
MGLTIISIVIKCTLMDENLGSMVADVTRLIRRSFDERARGIGVTRPQWRVLSVLLRNEGINQGGLADLLEVEPITLCRMVDRLQDGDLVERRPDPADRRAWRLYLTAKARELLEQLRPLAETVFDDALEGLSSAEQTQMMGALDRVRQNLSRKTHSPVLSHG